MTATPGRDASSRSFFKRASAGGQLEQPSEVNSSTTTARMEESVAGTGDREACDCAMYSRAEDPAIIVKVKYRKLIRISKPLALTLIRVERIQKVSGNERSRAKSS